MMEPDYPDRPFPLRTRRIPPRTVRQAARLVRLLLAHSAFGARAVPLISAGASWARLLMKAGERLEAWYRTGVREFLQLWSGDGVNSVDRFEGKKSPASQDSGSSRSLERAGRPGSPASRAKRVALPAEEKRPSHLDLLSRLVGADPPDASSDTQHAFPMTARISVRQIVRREPGPIETFRASRGDAVSFRFRPPVQDDSADQGNYDDESFRPAAGRDHTALSASWTYRTIEAPALSSAEILAGRIFGRKVFFTNRGHSEALSNPDLQRKNPVSLLHATEARQGTRSGFSQAQPSAYAPGGVDSAPSWSLQAAQSLGRPLGVIPRVILERSFPDLNLSQVRVHSDSPADLAARELGADAFVLGPDLFFRSGTFNPLTERGLALLTHELVHVRQSGDGPAPTAPSRRDALEREAREIEGALLGPSALPGPAQQPHAGSTVRPTFRAFSALALDLPRPAVPQPASDRGAGSNPQRAISLSLERFAGSRPLTAEAGRAASPSPEQATGSAGAESAAQDHDGLSHRLFRALERKIVIEKERRGIDRWAP